MKNLNVKKLLSIFYFVVLVSTLVSCKSSSVVPPATTDTTTTTKTIKEIKKDTTFNIPEDSSHYKVRLEIVNGEVNISQKAKPERIKGKYIKPPKVNIKDNILEVDCSAEAQKLFAEWKEIYTLENQTSITRVPYPVEKELNWWQELRIILGSIFLGLITLFVIVGILRLTKVI